MHLLIIGRAHIKHTRINTAFDCRARMEDLKIRLDAHKRANSSHKIWLLLAGRFSFGSWRNPMKRVISGVRGNITMRISFFARLIFFHCSNAWRKSNKREKISFFLFGQYVVFGRWWFSNKRKEIEIKHRPFNKIYFFLECNDATEIKRFPYFFLANFRWPSYSKNIENRLFFLPNI